MKKLILFLALIFLLHATPALAASKYWVGGGSSTNWSATVPTNWSDTDGGANNASIPTTGDDVFFKSSADAVIDVNTASLKSFDMTGYTGTLSGSNTLTVSGADSTTVNIKFGGTITWTGLFTVATGGTDRVYNIYSNGKTIGSFIFSPSAGGTGNLMDNMSLVTTFQVNSGVMNTNGYQIDCGAFNLGNTDSVRTLDMTNSTVNISGVGTIIGMVRTANTTLVSTGSTINLTDTSASTKAVNISTTAGSGLAFNDLNISGGNTGAITFNMGGSSFNNFTINAPNTVKFTSAKTFSVSSFNATGSIGNLITITSSSAGSPFTISKSSGTVLIDYVSLKDSTATGGAIFRAGIGSINVSGNTGWTFLTPFYPSYGIASGIVGYWTFDTRLTNWSSPSAGSTLDSSGNFFNGVLNGMTKIGSTVLGKIFQALSFDGSTSYVSLGDSNSFSFGNGTTDSPFSITGWLYPNDSNSQILLAKDQFVGAWTGRREYTLSANTAVGIGLSLFSNGADSSGTPTISANTGGAGYTVGKWNFIVATYDGSSANTGIKIYSNGVPMPMTVGGSGVYVAMTNTATPLEIGRRFYSAGGAPNIYTNGKIDDVRLYNRKLSSQEAYQLYRIGLSTH